MVTEFFGTCKLPKDISSSFVALIPKNKNPASFCVQAYQSHTWSLQNYGEAAFFSAEDCYVRYCKCESVNIYCGAADSRRFYDSKRGSSGN